MPRLYMFVDAFGMGTTVLMAIFPRLAKTIGFPNSRETANAIPEMTENSDAGNGLSWSYGNANAEMMISSGIN